MTRYMLASLMGLSPSSSLWGAWRARKIGPFSSPAFPRYSASASAAAKWIPMVRCLLPFSFRQRRLLAVLVKVLNPQAAGGGEPDAGVEVGFQDGAVAEIE